MGFATLYPSYALVLIHDMDTECNEEVTVRVATRAKGTVFCIPLEIVAALTFD